MDAKIFFTTFVTIFIAEMGDKTQFAAVAAASSSQSLVSVWLAVVLALAASGTLGVLGGRILGTYLNPETLRWVSGLLFIGVGIWVLWRR